MSRIESGKVTLEEQEVNLGVLVQELKISKEDIRLMKHYNMFVMV